MKLKGCATALVTPFKDGQVDYQAYRRLVRSQVQAGVSFLVPLGTTAETPCLTDEEKTALLAATREEAPGLPLVAGVGSNSVSGTLRNIRLLEPYGADAWLVVVPFYNKPTQEGMYQYFKTISEASGKPIVLYNVPGRTGSNLKAETTIRLSKLPGIIGIKEASGNLEQIYKIRRETPEDFFVLSGNDDQTLPLMAGGVGGVISVVSNLAPKLMCGLCKAVEDSDLAKAKELNDLMLPLAKACFVESNPIAVKGGLSLQGVCRNELRLPLTPATDSTLEVMRGALESLGLL